MSVKFNNDSGKIVCKFEGRMDTSKCLEAEQEVLENIEGAKSVVFDLSGVEYIASSFLRLCGKVAHKTGIDNYSIINATPPVRKVFKIAGLSERLNLE